MKHKVWRKYLYCLPESNNGGAKTREAGPSAAAAVHKLEANYSAGLGRGFVRSAHVCKIRDVHHKI